MNYQMEKNMVLNSQLRKPIAKLLIAGTLGLGNACIVQDVQAAMISTENALATVYQQQDKQKVVDFMGQAQVQSFMAENGIDQTEAQARINALSDAELARLSASIGDFQTQPAGGDILGTLVLVFLVLLVTDILGLTNVFPFVNHSNAHIRK
jgi:hypothetical protein